MFTKVRICISFILFIILVLLVLPLVLHQTTHFTPLCSYTFLCLLIALLLENTITFLLLNTLDHFKWLNDSNGKFLTLFVKVFIVLTLLIFSFISFKDVNQVNPLLIYMLFLPLLLTHQNIYLGNRFIYSQGIYIDLSEIMSYKQTTYKNYSQFILYTSRGMHIVKFQCSQKTGILALHQKLDSLSKSSDQPF